MKRLPFEKVQAFLHQHFWQSAHIAPLPADCSPRRYYRLTEEGRGCLLMVDPPPTSQLPRYRKIATLLASQGFKVPAIFAVNEELGVALIEDFGSNTFTKVLQNKDNLRALYHLATQTIIALRQTFKEEDYQGFSSFTLEKMLDELDLFYQWYYPEVMGKDMPPSEQKALLALMEESLLKADKLPKTLMLKDFHVDNLMLLSDGQDSSCCGLLDFQDAVFGSPAYDLASLLQDSRIEIPEGLIKECRQLYMQAFKDRAPFLFEQAYETLGAQRNLKNLGIFARMNRLYGKPHYLSFIPRLWKNLEDNLAHPSLAGLKGWLDKVLPASHRIMPSASLTKKENNA